MSLDAATALTPAGPHRYLARLDAGWWLDGTAFGGYLAALLLRAIAAGVEAPDQRVLALAVHFGGRVAPGEALVTVRPDQLGRSVSSVSATLSQGGVTTTCATASFGRRRGGPPLRRWPQPAVPAAADCPELTVRPQVRERFALAARFERRRLPAGPVGGWIRLAEPRPPDELSVVTLLDSWTAAVAALVPVRRMLTVAYHVQFLAEPVGLSADDYALVTFEAGSVSDGYADDDGELWAGDVLVARSRQAVLIGD
ncbi:acyl-CoA thioesterase [Pseudofrankia asymbiotica]|uniref:Thioesterase n=1 Tax=Pseudofrankia asymbiotica TaxID=1834516 RepID=A0A1V2IFR1_9ACTN|nr:thioesterase family protein [Pseudofrankia asymbiotica]ONH31729.1 hypothetical protein BL253_08710 [Pseudofrankia asymbiotica]